MRELVAGGLVGLVMTGAIIYALNVERIDSSQKIPPSPSSTPERRQVSSVAKRGDKPLPRISYLETTEFKNQTEPSRDEKPAPRHLAESPIYAPELANCYSTAGKTLTELDKAISQLQALNTAK